MTQQASFRAPRRPTVQTLTDKAVGASLLLLAAAILSYYTVWVVVTVRVAGQRQR